MSETTPRNSIGGASERLCDSSGRRVVEILDIIYAPTPAHSPFIGQGSHCLSGGYADVARQSKFNAVCLMMPDIHQPTSYKYGKGRPARPAPKS